MIGVETSKIENTKVRRAIHEEGDLEQEPIGGARTAFSYTGGTRKIESMMHHSDDIILPFRYTRKKSRTAVSKDG